MTGFRPAMDLAQAGVTTQAFVGLEVHQGRLAEIVAALTGHYRPEHLFALRQNLELFDACQGQLVDCDRAIAAHVQQLTAQVAAPVTPRLSGPGVDAARPPSRRRAAAAGSPGAGYWS